MEMVPFIWLLILLLAGAPLTYLVGRLFGSRYGHWTALVLLASAWWPYTSCIQQLTDQPRVIFTYQQISLRFDGLSLLFTGLGLLLATLVALYSGPYLQAEVGQEKFYAMLLVMAGAIAGLSCAGDLFNLWIWFEAMAISSYLLVAFYHEQPASLEAGIKYLVQSAAGSVLVLAGLSLVFAVSGETAFYALRGLAYSPVMMAAGALFVIGFGVKAALVPVHTWLPDAHSQAPSGISAMLSGIVIEAGLLAMLRVLDLFTSSTATWGLVLLGFGALNMLVGNLLALRQSQIKRLLAFSSLAHVGYMLTGIGISFYSGEAAGMQGGFFHLLNHGLMKGLAFLAAGCFLYALRLKAGDHGPLEIPDLAGAAQRYPLTTALFSLSLMALGGIPPLAGFMSKWQIMLAGFSSQDGLLIGMAAFAAFNSLLSLAYYMPVVAVCYQKQPSELVQKGGKIQVGMLIPLVVLSAAVLAIGFYPQLAAWLVAPTGQILTALAW